MPETLAAPRMDAVAEILRAMRLSGGVFLDAELTAPWCLRAKVDDEDCRPFGGSPERLVAYHYIVEGQLVLSVDEQAPLTAGAGHLLVLPRNDTHLLGSTAGLPPEDAAAYIEPAGEDGLVRIRFGGGGARTRVLCGFLGCDRQADALIAGLPRVITLDLSEGLTGTWIEGSIRYAARELITRGEGARASLARLAELLFAEAVREYLSTSRTGEGAWLAGLRDAYVARALALIHTRLEHPWSLEELARQVGLSRSAFTERFTRTLQVSPMQYLAGRRLERAADHLRHGTTPISRIATDAGYESEASFTRAFKRRFGTTPGAFRKNARQPAQALDSRAANGRVDET